MRADPADWSRSPNVEQAQAELRAAAAEADVESAISDRQLADKLIEMGRLNSYQAAQLLDGRRS